MRSGFIGIIGRPNVGKSTLLNRMLDEKVAITSPKPQTTRNSIRGILTREDNRGEPTCQMVFIDTPGMHKGRNRLGTAMTDMAVSTMREVDVILFLVDSPIDKGPGDSYIVDMLREVDTPRILVINKIDTMEPEEYVGIYKAYEEMGIFHDIYGASALKGDNVTDLVEKLESMMPEGPLFFPKDMYTDYPERFLVSEVIREKILNYLDEEVPHGVAVEIESFVEEDDMDRIHAVIYCEKKSHKGIIIGKGGKKLKGIGKAARLELEALLGTKIYLELFVKVRENWRNSDFDLTNFGYLEKD